MQQAFERGAVCEVVLDAVTLDNKKGKIALHRAVVLGMNDREVTFHDPRTNKPRPKRKENIKLFKKAWLDALESPELCVYENVDS